MYKYLKPPYPRYTAPYPVLYAKVPHRRRRRRDQKLYGARLVNSPYLYDDPYTTVAINDPYAVPTKQKTGSLNISKSTKDTVFGVLAGIFVCSLLKR